MASRGYRRRRLSVAEVVASTVGRVKSDIWLDVELSSNGHHLYEVILDAATHRRERIQPFSAEKDDRLTSVGERPCPSSDVTLAVAGTAGDDAHASAQRTRALGAGSTDGAQGPASLVAPGYVLYHRADRTGGGRLAAPAHGANAARGRGGQLLVFGPQRRQAGSCWPKYYVEGVHRFGKPSTRTFTVGLAGIEPATSALSVLRSNRLSYSPRVLP